MTKRVPLSLLLRKILWFKAMNLYFFIQICACSKVYNFFYNVYNKQVKWYSKLILKSWNWIAVKLFDTCFLLSTIELDLQIILKISIWNPYYSVSFRYPEARTYLSHAFHGSNSGFVKNTFKAKKNNFVPHTYCYRIENGVC